MLFLVYPTLLPSKEVDPLQPSGGTGSTGAGGSSGAAGGGSGDKLSLGGMDARRSALASGRRPREDGEGTPAEGGGESLRTASVALSADRYKPKIYGFQVHEIAKLQRWQEAVRDKQVAKLETLERAESTKAS